MPSRTRREKRSSRGDPPFCDGRAPAPPTCQRATLLKLAFTDRSLGTEGRAVSVPAQRSDIAALPVSPAGSRSIAHSGGEDPAWMTPTTLNPCRS